MPIRKLYALKFAKGAKKSREYAPRGKISPALPGMDGGHGKGARRVLRFLDFVEFARDNAPPHFTCNISSQAVV